MEQINVKAKVIVNNQNGNVKVVSKKGRLAFPVEVIETGAGLHRRVGNKWEFLQLLREFRQRSKGRFISKSTIIEQRINALIRSLHYAD